MSAALCMSVIGPFEDDPPNHYSQAMPENDDPREAATLPPDTDAADTEPPTASEHAIPMPREAMNPPPQPTADSILIDCMNQLLEGNESLKRIRFDLLAPDGAFAERQREHRRELVRELREAVIPRIASLEQTVEKLQAEVAKLKQRLDEQQEALDETNRSITLVQKRLEDAKQARPAEAAPAEPA